MEFPTEVNPGDVLPFSTGKATVLYQDYIKGGEGRPEKFLLLIHRAGVKINPFVVCYIDAQTCACGEWWQGYYSDAAAPAVKEFMARRKLNGLA